MQYRDDCGIPAGGVELGSSCTGRGRSSHSGTGTCAALCCAAPGRDGVSTLQAAVATRQATQLGGGVGLTMRSFLSVEAFRRRHLVETFRVVQVRALFVFERRGLVAQEGLGADDHSDPIPQASGCRARVQHLYVAPRAAANEALWDEATIPAQADSSVSRSLKATTCVASSRAQCVGSVA